MSLTIQQNTPTVVDLVSEAKSTGWSLLPNGTAHHETCNAGYIIVKDDLLVVVTGNVYTVSYQIKDYVSGTLRLSIGNALAPIRNANGNYTDTLTATGVNPKIRIFSDGNLTLALFDIKTDTASTITKQRNTINFSEQNNKWSSYSSFTSDFGFSLFKDMFTFKNGRLYKHDPAIGTRNNIYGVQYDTVVRIPFSGAEGQVKTFLSLSYESNQLMVTTDDGITTSLGQVSELIDSDFLKDTLQSGMTVIDIYDVEGVYSSSFLRDTSNGGDINNGDVLKGTYVVVELIQVNDELLSLKNVIVHSESSKIGAR